MRGGLSIGPHHQFEAPLPWVLRLAVLRRDKLEAPRLLTDYRQVVLVHRVIEALPAATTNTINCKALLTTPADKIGIIEAKQNTI
jgi:hypothetical protein